MSTDAIGYTFGLLLIGMTMVAVRSSYYILRFFAGAMWWAFGVWLVSNPLVSGADPINDIMVILCFFGGLALMLMMGWRTSTNNGREIGEFNIRLPRLFGGRSEEDEVEEARRNARTWRDRRAIYRDRLNNTIKGKR